MALAIHKPTKVTYAAGRRDDAVVRAVRRKGPKISQRARNCPRIDLKEMGGKRYESTGIVKWYCFRSPQIPQGFADSHATLNILPLIGEELD